MRLLALFLVCLAVGSSSVYVKQAGTWRRRTDTDQTVYVKQAGVWRINVGDANATRTQIYTKQNGGWIIGASE